MSGPAGRPDLRQMSAALHGIQMARALTEIGQASHVLAEHLADLAQSADPELQTALEMAVLAAEHIENIAARHGS